MDHWIAAGGMGEVWQATDLVLARPVAVKLLHPGFAEQQDDLARFRAEARHAGLLSDPGIAQVFDYREDPPEPPYLVMELIDGPSLSRLLADGPLEPAPTLGIIAQAARGLYAAHSAGLVHRDIKPGNLLLSKTGRVKITDFGIAYLAGSAPLTRPGTLMGSPAYLAPERAAGAPATPAADVYALGIVAFQCLTGRPPFTGPPLAVALAHRERAMPPLPPWVPAGVAALVADMTAKDPRARPASAAEVAERAQHLRMALHAEAGQQHAKLSGRRARRPAYAALAAIAVAGVAATGWGLTGLLKPAPAQTGPGPAASRSSAPHTSLPAQRATRTSGAGAVSTTEAPAHAVPAAGSHQSSAPVSSPVVTPTTPATPTSTAPIPSRPPAPSGTPTPTGTSVTGTPTPSVTPTPSGTPAPTGTLASGTPAPPTGTATPTPGSS